MFATAALAVDVNKATQADLESVKGIGPAVSTQVLAERRKGEFKDWNDFVLGVKGSGAGSAAGLSQAGLTVHGRPSASAADAASPARK
ncbi:MAG TPA: helix-hairpin-helix domain-containing protein [Caldimonas sp.]